MTSGKWKTSHRRERLPHNWKTEIVPYVMARDNRQCQHIREDTQTKCLAPATDIDHKTRGDNHNPDNLQALCPWHHKQKTAHEGGNASRKANQQRNRATTRRNQHQHPGLTAQPSKQKTKNTEKHRP